MMKVYYRGDDARWYEEGEQPSGYTLEKPTAEPETVEPDVEQEPEPEPETVEVEEKAEQPANKAKKAANKKTGTK